MSGRPPTSAPSAGRRASPPGGSGPATGTPDGRTAVVDLTGEAELPMVGGMLRELGVGITIHVTSSARSDVVQP